MDGVAVLILLTIILLVFASGFLVGQIVILREFATAIRKEDAFDHNLEGR